MNPLPLWIKFNDYGDWCYQYRIPDIKEFVKGFKYQMCTSSIGKYDKYGGVKFFDEVWSECEVGSAFDWKMEIIENSLKTGDIRVKKNINESNNKKETMRLFYGYLNTCKIEEKYGSRYTVSTNLPSDIKFIVVPAKSKEDAKLKILSELLTTDFSDPNDSEGRKSLDRVLTINGKEQYRVDGLHEIKTNYHVIASIGTNSEMESNIISNYFEIIDEWFCFSKPFALFCKSRDNIFVLEDNEQLKENIYKEIFKASGITEKSIKIKPDLSCFRRLFEKKLLIRKGKKDVIVPQLKKIIPEFTSEVIVPNSKRIQKELVGGIIKESTGGKVSNVNGSRLVITKFIPLDNSGNVQPKKSPNRLVYISTKDRKRFKRLTWRWANYLVKKFPDKYEFISKKEGRKLQEPISGRSFIPDNIDKRYKIIPVEVEYIEQEIIRDPDHGPIIYKDTDKTFIKWEHQLYYDKGVDGKYHKYKKITPNKSSSKRILFTNYTTKKTTSGRIKKHPGSSQGISKDGVNKFLTKPENPTPKNYFFISHVRYITPFMIKIQRPDGSVLKKEVKSITSYNKVYKPILNKKFEEKVKIEKEILNNELKIIKKNKEQVIKKNRINTNRDIIIHKDKEAVLV